MYTKINRYIVRNIIYQIQYAQSVAFCDTFFGGSGLRYRSVECKYVIWDRKRVIGPKTTGNRGHKSKFGSRNIDIGKLFNSLIF